MAHELGVPVGKYNSEGIDGREAFETAQKNLGILGLECAGVADSIAWGTKCARLRMELVGEQPFSEHQIAVWQHVLPCSSSPWKTKGAFGVLVGKNITYVHPDVVARLVEVFDAGVFDDIVVWEAQANEYGARRPWDMFVVGSITVGKKTYTWPIVQMTRSQKEELCTFEQACAQYIADAQKLAGKLLGCRYWRSWTWRLLLPIVGALALYLGLSWPEKVCTLLGIFGVMLSWARAFFLSAERRCRREEMQRIIRMFAPAVVLPTMPTLNERFEALAVNLRTRFKLS